MTDQLSLLPDLDRASDSRKQNQKGRLNSLKKSRAYFERHKDDPAWREHRRQLQKAWKQRKREEKEKQAA